MVEPRWHTSRTLNLGSPCRASINQCLQRDAARAQTPSSTENRRLTIARLQATASQDYLEQATRAQLPEKLNHVEHIASEGISRRGLLAIVCVGYLGLAQASRAASVEQQLYAQTKQGYSVSIPSDWTTKEKAGADILFENPAMKSTNVGVTVSPVRIKTITEFGDVSSVGEKLLAAERSKESTLSVEMLSQGSRTLDTGSVLYDYEYELDSTRGRKRIINAVSINNSKLYILNAQHKCAKDGCTSEDLESVAILANIAQSFSVQ